MKSSSLEIRHNLCFHHFHTSSPSFSKIRFCYYIILNKQHSLHKTEERVSNINVFVFERIKMENIYILGENTCEHIINTSNVILSVVLLICRSWLYFRLGYGPELLNPIQKQTFSFFLLSVIPKSFGALLWLFSIILVLPSGRSVHLNWSQGPYYLIV
jgi:hypothetical protein